MQKLVLQMFSSLDGFVDGLDGTQEFRSAVHDDELLSWLLSSNSPVGAHIFGRVAYQELFTEGPIITCGLAATIANAPKVVFSRSLRKARWEHTKIARGVLFDEVSCLKEQAEGSIVAHGGAQFARSLSRIGIIDEYQLLLLPVLAGHGRRIFEDLDCSHSLRFVDAVKFRSGVVIVQYKRRFPAPDLAPGLA